MNSFFRRFVYNFACIAKPLTKLTKTDVSWICGEEQEKAFLEKKSKLTTRPVLALNNSEFITEVHCDPSKVGVGGILLQKPDEELPLRPVAYFRRQTTREEEFWHSFELETMAVVMALKRSRVYLIGIEFKVITDCNQNSSNYYIILDNYWFPKMKRFIRKYVKSCINCAYNKEMAGKKSGFLHPIPKVSAIFILFTWTT